MPEHCTKNEVFDQGFPNPADMVTFTEEVLNGELHFLCSGMWVRENHKFKSLSSQNDKS